MPREDADSHRSRTSPRWTRQSCVFGTCAKVAVPVTPSIGYSNVSVAFVFVADRPVIRRNAVPFFASASSSHTTCDPDTHAVHRAVQWTMTFSEDHRVDRRSSSRAASLSNQLRMVRHFAGVRPFGGVGSASASSNHVSDLST